MHHHRITISNDSNRNIENLYQLMKAPPLIDIEIVLDLSHLNFCSSRLVVFIVMFIIYLKNKKYTIRIIRPFSLKCNQYISDIDLDRFCETNTIKHETIHCIDSSTAMPIKRLAKENLNEYINSVTDHFNANCLWQGKDSTILNANISELINNVYDHANSPIDAYIFSQFFPNMNCLSIVVGDYGDGIPEVVNRFLKLNQKDLLTDVDCIKWAVQLNQSTKSQPHNQGKGLNNIMSAAETGSSDLRIYSNGALLIVNKRFTSYRANPIQHFKGTVVEVNINIDKLPDNEDGLIDDFFNNFY